MQKKYSFASKRGAPPQTHNLPPQRQPKYMRVTLTTLTQHITSPEYLKSLIDSKAHYQVIPAIPQLLCWDVNSLIAVAVECSRGKVLDIVLPYRLIKPHFYSDYFFGRHIFMNGKLVGIRLATFASGSSVQRYSHSNMLKAPKREVLHVQIWQGLKQIYKQLQIPFQPEETLPVGDFLLEFNNAKFGLLFQSEIDQSRTIISDYYYQGVTVLSVVDDTISHLAKDGNYPVSNNYFIQNLQVQKISNNSDGKLVMCTGVRMVGFDWTYLTIANISTIDNQRSKGSKSMWNDSWWVQTCQLPFYDSQQQSQCLLPTKLMQQPPTITIKEQIPTCSAVGNESGCQMLLDKRNKVKQSTGKQKNDLQPMFRLIYVYKHINKGCRFTVPHNIGHQFYSALLKFGAFADRPLQILIHLYKVQGKEISVAGNALVQIGLKIYSSIEQLVQSMPQEKIYVYTQNQTQLIGLQKLAAKTENVFICGQFPKKIIGKMELPRSSVIKSMDSFVNEAFQQQIFDMQQLLKRVRNSNYRLKIKSQVEAIAFRMKQKLHQCYVLTPFTEYILSSSLEQIKKKLQAAQVSLHNSQEGITQHSRDPERPKDSYPHQIKKKALQVQNFTKILESAIKHKKLNLSQSRMTCHVCKVIFPGDLVYSCEGCRFQICLACIRQALKPTKEMTKTKKTFQYCLVCNNLCQCKDCLNKRLGPNDRTEAIQVESQNCLECKKNGRAFVNIKIECKSCIAKVCWACAKADEEQRIGPGYSYRCKQCTEAQRIKEQRQLDFESLRYTMALIKSNNSIQDFEAVQDRQIQEARPAEKYRDEGPKQEKQTDSHLLAKDQTLQRKIRKTKKRKRSRSNDRRKSPSRQKKRRPSSSSSSSSRSSSSSSSSSSESQRSSRNKKMRQSSRNRKKESSNNQRNKSSPKKKRKKSSDSDSSSPPIRQKKLKKIPMLQQILNDLKKFRQGSSQSHDRKKSKKIAKDRDHSQRNQVESRAQSQRANKNNHPTHLRPNFQKKGLWGDRQQVPRLNSLMQANLREKQGMEPGQVQVLPQSGLILPFNRYESKDDIQY